MIWQNESGSLGVIFAMAIIPAFATVGVALDYSRSTQAKAVIQEASDSAALAALSDITKKPDSELAIKVFNARVGAERTLIQTRPVVIVHDDDRVEVRGEGRVKTMVPLSGKTYVDIGSTSIARRSSQAQPINLNVYFESSDASDLNEIYIYTLKKGEIVPDSQQFAFSNASSYINKNFSIAVQDGDIWGFSLKNANGRFFKDGDEKKSRTTTYYSHENPFVLKASPVICDGKTMNYHYWEDRNNNSDKDYNDMIYKFMCESPSGSGQKRARIEK